MNYVSTLLKRKTKKPNSEITVFKLILTCEYVSPHIFIKSVDNLLSEIPVSKKNKKKLLSSQVAEI